MMTDSILVFVNSLSGGKQGSTVLNGLLKHIPKENIFDLATAKFGWSPEIPLRDHFDHNHSAKVLVCGGDGTAGWILASIDAVYEEKQMLHQARPPVVAEKPAQSEEVGAADGAPRPRRLSRLQPSFPAREDVYPIAVMPLGTGNDLARTLSWGAGFSKAMLKSKFLDSVANADFGVMDRWQLFIRPLEPGTNRHVRGEHEAAAQAGPATPHETDELQQFENKSLRLDAAAAAADEPADDPAAAQSVKSAPAATDRAAPDAPPIKTIVSEKRAPPHPVENVVLRVDQPLPAGMTAAGLAALPDTQYPHGIQRLQINAPPLQKLRSQDAFVGLETPAVGQAAPQRDPVHPSDEEQTSRSEPATTVPSPAKTEPSQLDQPAETLHTADGALTAPVEVSTAPVETSLSPTRRPRTASHGASRASPGSQHRHKSSHIRLPDGQLVSMSPLATQVQSSATAEPALRRPSSPPVAGSKGTFTRDFRGRVHVPRPSVSALADAPSTSSRAPAVSANRRAISVAEAGPAVQDGVWDTGVHRFSRTGGLDRGRRIQSSADVIHARNELRSQLHSDLQDLVQGGDVRPQAVATPEVPAAMTSEGAADIDRTTPSLPPPAAAQGEVSDAVDITDVTVVHPEMPLVPAEEYLDYFGVFCNYFSIGVDAQVAHGFHTAREAHPYRFSSQLKNKLWYGWYGAVHGSAIPCCTGPHGRPPRLHQSLKMYVAPTGYEPHPILGPSPLGDDAIGDTQDVNFTELKVPSGIRSIILLNIPYFSGGLTMWGGKKSQDFTAQSICDRRIEIVGLRSAAHLGCMQVFNKTGMRAVRLGQSSRVRFHLEQPMFAQVDGEPWLQVPCDIDVSLHSQSAVLTPPSRQPKASSKRRASGSAAV